MLDIRKQNLDARLNLSISSGMEAHLQSIAQARNVSVSLVARELIADSLLRNFGKIEVRPDEVKKKRKYTKRQPQASAN